MALSYRVSRFTLSLYFRYEYDNSFKNEKVALRKVRYIRFVSANKQITMIAISMAKYMNMMLTYTLPVINERSFCIKENILIHRKNV